MLMDFGFPEARARTVTIAQFLMLWDRWIDGEDRLNFRATIVAAFVANSAATGKKRRKAIQPHDIIPSLKEHHHKEEQFNSIEDQVAALKMLYGDQQFESDVPAQD